MGLNNIQTGGSGGLSDGGLRNLTEISAIPDSVVAQYDATQLSLNDGETVSTWPDEVGSADLSADSGSPTLTTGVFNDGGMPAVQYDGGSDAHRTDAFGPVSQPFAKLAVIVGLGKETDANAQWVSDGTTERAIIGIRADDGVPVTWASNFVEGGSYSDNTQYVQSGVFDGANSSARLNGSVQASGDAGTNGQEGMTIGASNDLSGNFANVHVGELIVLDDITEVPEAESFLANKWGINSGNFESETYQTSQESFSMGTLNEDSFN